MSVVIRLSRSGRTHHPVYRISVADHRVAATGKFLQQIGFYDPNSATPTAKIDEASAIAWIEKGARLTPTVERIFSRMGLLAKHTQVKKGIPLTAAKAEVRNWKPAKKVLSKKAVAKKAAEAAEKAKETAAPVEA